jgi:hypothetical protein
MSELTDDQLDELFRKSAEEFKTPFDSAAWQDMKARLDTHDRLGPTSGASQMKNILRWGLPTILLLLLVGWAVYQSIIPTGLVAIPSAKSEPGKTKLVTVGGERPLVSNRSDNGEVASGKSMRVPEQAVTFSRPETGLEKVTADRNRVESPINALPSRPTETREVADKGRGVKRSGKEERDYSESVSVAKKKKVSRSSLNKLSYTATNAQTTTRRGFLIENRPSGSSFSGKRRKSTADDEMTTSPNNVYRLKAGLVSNKQRGINTPVEMSASGSTGSENEFPSSTNEPTAIALPDVEALAIRPAKWPTLLPVVNRSVEVHPDTTASKIASQPVAVRGLSIRFAVSPDLSGVGLKNFARPGTNVGLLLEYRLASRWSVQAGLIQSTKVYKALTSEYAVPTGWWKAPMKTPESVDGRCTMFDIPINIRYDVVIKPRLDGRLPTRWFASGGVTSYIMKNEEYYYNYPPHTYNQPTKYDVSTGGYGFSNLNLSVGYERSISRRLSWQVEPFMKVPLKGVGNFKVRLLSTGTFFSLRYKL